MKQFTFYEFFAGVGLAGMGLGKNWRCQWANDIDTQKTEIYKHNFGDQRLVVADIATINAQDIPGSVDLAWASFPCQDLSLAGWQRGITGSRSGTFWAFWRLMKSLKAEGRKPPVIVMENVTGLLRPSDFTPLCAALAELDMRFGALVMDARCFVPQSRPRVFVVAVDQMIDDSAFNYGEFQPDNPWAVDALKRAYDELPDDLRALWRWWRVPPPPPMETTIDSIIEADPIGVQWHSESETQRLLGMMSAGNLRKVDQARRSGRPRVGFIYKRMREGQQRAEARFDGLAGCLRTPHGGSSRQIVLVVNGDEVKSRLLSPREAARLMGVPDNYWLPPKYNQAYFAMGDGVAVPVVSWLANTLLEPLVQHARMAAAIKATDIFTPRKAGNVLRAEHFASTWERRSS